MRELLKRAVSRRRVLLGGSTALLATIALPARSESCGHPDELSDGEQSMRQSLEYTEHAADENKACRGCGYFKAAATGACGQCLILNGTVSAQGHCDSWTAKQESAR